MKMEGRPVAPVTRVMRVSMPFAMRGQRDSMGLSPGHEHLVYLQLDTDGREMMSLYWVKVHSLAMHWRERFLLLMPVTWALILHCFAWVLQPKFSSANFAIAFGLVLCMVGSHLNALVLGAACRLVYI